MKEVKTIEKKGKFDQRAYIDRYHKEHYKSVAFRVNVETEKDILEKLSNVQNKAEYIKWLIRNDIKK